MTAPQRLLTFLADHDTMTVATVDREGQPQAAAVFYAADERVQLYFLSSPNSRHSQNLQRNSRVAATVHGDGQPWQEIQGLQIEGTAERVASVQELARAARVYARRFPFLKDILTGTGDGPPILRGPVASSRFYVLRPAWIRLIDNSQGFGYREEWLEVDGEWQRQRHDD